MLRSTLHFSNRPVVAAALFFFLLVPLAAAQLNWEGQTGGLITPFAYTSSSSMGVGRPQLALHYLNGGPVLGNDFQVSITAAFSKWPKVDSRGLSTSWGTTNWLHGSPMGSMRRTSSSA